MTAHASEKVWFKMPIGDVDTKSSTNFMNNSFFDDLNSIALNGLVMAAFLQENCRSFAISWKHF